MPQLDFSTYITQIFWLLISFGLLYIIVSNFIVPHLSNIITSRNVKIETDLLQADQLKKNAKNIYDDIEKEYQKARKKANKKINEVIQETQQQTAEALIKQEQEIIEKTHFAEHRIEAMLKNSQPELQKLSQDIIKNIVSKFIKDNIEDNMIDDVLKQAQNNNNQG